MASPAYRAPINWNDKDSKTEQPRPNSQVSNLRHVLRHGIVHTALQWSVSCAMLLGGMDRLWTASSGVAERLTRSADCFSGRVSPIFQGPRAHRLETNHTLTMVTVDFHERVHLWLPRSELAHQLDHPEGLRTLDFGIHRRFLRTRARPRAPNFPTCMVHGQQGKERKGSAMARVEEECRFRGDLGVHHRGTLCSVDCALRVAGPEQG